jgi:hypothetical protein
MSELANGVITHDSGYLEVVFDHLHATSMRGCRAAGITAETLVA